MSTPARVSLVVASTLLLLLSTSCSKSTTVNWPGVPFHEVRLYAYNFIIDPSNPLPPLFNNDGTPHASVINSPGLRLDHEQQRRLLEILRSPKEQTEAYGCGFNPRHAIVFFDDAGKSAAQMLICFECKVFEEVPEAFDGRKQSLDYARLADFMREVGLPVFSSYSEYEAYARDLKK
ncbi:MAG: hypothetical protein J0M17_10395 [Planctomycetes bacterium]|nr:hypothetical protein [Planctomycetota bacterium]